ncbi:motility associated factor glycosyltransferase family protein [Bacillus sp. FJAT-42315]|uniref:motility associated factor glycosyltransferase family protein n=1 Tax=Bacillus sp. FJAT-42315 TaxID=2014077 RepID=UPI000C2460D5|nr:6-hydroxymethylpterin diphosphokinase MptE-like protein [Bacillus sp. FJAT-42315]
MKFELIETRTAPTVKVCKEDSYFYLHSKYDPLKEAVKWVGGIDQEKLQTKELMVIGCGVGYHIRALRQVCPNKKIAVYELNSHFYDWIVQTGEMDDLLKDENITFLVVRSNIDLSNFANELKEEMIIFKPSLKIVDDRFREMAHTLENYLIQERTMKDQRKDLIENFYGNSQLGDKGIRALNLKYSNKAILVSAGPSLTKQLSLLKQVAMSEKFIIGCVGTAFIPLIRFGIKPDFVMIADPKEVIAEQLDIEQDKIPLLYLSTANSKAVMNYRGPRFIIWQKGFLLAETEAGKRNEPLIATGGSVATCLLDVLVTLGAKSIALIGQDLAFTDQKSHAENTHAQRNIKDSPFLLKVMDYYQKKFVYTSRNLAVYLKWFERYVERDTDTEFFNCTEGGAYIKGWNHCPFSKYIKNF